jgi:hypothetical protein
MRKMRPRIKTFRTFESVTGGLTPEQESWLDLGSVGTWSLNAEGRVNIQGNFNCSTQNLSNLKGVKFENIEGIFDCSYNKITSLEGAPEEIESNFWCNMNRLVNLKGAPRKVIGNFNCSYNKLTSLEGAPREVGGGFNCYWNKLTSLEGAPQKIGGVFRFSSGIGSTEFIIPEGQWGPAGWVQALETIDDPKARALVLTLLDPKPLLAKLKGDPKQDGQVLLELSYLWGVPGAESIQKELEASLTPVQIKSIQALRKMHGYL